MAGICGKTLRGIKNGRAAASARSKNARPSNRPNSNGRPVCSDRIGMIAPSAPLRIERVVLDFDGTFTRVDKEAAGFVAGYKQSLAAKLETDIPEVERLWKKAQHVAEANPSQHGWETDGKVVAPAYADPLIMAKAVAGIIFNNRGLYMDPSHRAEVLEGFFQANYGRMNTLFKSDAAEALRALNDRFQVCIVTNSGTGSVLRKLEKLPGPRVEVQVYGDAKKYCLDPAWADVPESVEREGFGRPLFLRRRLYWNVLNDIMAAQGIVPEQVAVIGDILELDLLLPLHQRMTGILTPRESTPSFEVNAVRSEEKGYVASSLTDAVNYLGAKRVRTA